MRFFGDQRLSQRAYIFRMDQETPLEKQLAMRRRAQAFAVETVRLTRSLPRSREGRHVASQLIRCSTSVGANYRAACRAKSRRDFISKIGIVLEESDETLYWLELAADLQLLTNEKAASATSEARQLVAIFTATRSTARKNSRV